MLNKKIKIFLFFLIPLCLFVSTIIVSHGTTYARVESSDVVAKKALLQGINYCYTTGKIKDSVSSLSDFHTFESLINNTGETYVAFPSGLTMTNDNNGSCKELFIGFDLGSQNKFQGLFKLFGKKYDGFSDSNDYSEKRTFLEGMGYTKQDTSGNCIVFKYSKTTYNLSSGKEQSMEAYTKNICVEDGIFKEQQYGTTGNFGGPSLVPITFTFSNDKSKITKLKADHGSNSSAEDLGKVEVDVDISADSTSWQTQLRSDISTNFSFLSGQGGGNPVAVKQGGFYSYDQEHVSGEGESSYKIVEDRRNGKWGYAADKAINYISGGTYTGRSSLQYTEAEQLSYYIQVLKEWFYDGTTDYDSYWLCSSDDNAVDWNDYGNYNKEIKRTPKGALGNCRIALSNAKSGRTEAYGIKDNYFDSSGSTTLSLGEVIDKINELSDKVGEDEVLDTDSSEDKKETKVDCLSSGAAENLGWIICPVLSFADEVSNQLYEQLIKPALIINPSLIGGEGSESDNAYEAWTIFQGFANTLFIIFFLFVIFSQVTGVGIDNYGIKKIMPKLIIAAILVNLSYVICQVCVDLSNIIGNGIQDIFNTLANNVTIDATLKGKNIGEQIGTTMISAVGIAGAAYLAYVTAAVWVLPLLVAMIGAIISILFLFILLAGRQAIVVILTVISPLAFACYLLPNTKKLFDKYVKIGEVMLLLYPICNLMMAGGGYVSKLLLSIPSGELDLFYTFTAMIMSIIPIFFIPKVVKSSFNALGSMGASISGFGARLSGRAKGAIKGSGAYRAGQERLGAAQTRWRAGIGADGKPVDMTLGQRLLRGSFTDRGIARARAQALKDQDARDRAERLSGDVGFQAAQIAQEKAAKSDQLNDYMAYINSETNNGEDEDAFNELVKKYTKEGQENEFGALAAARIAGRRKDTADKFLNNHFNNANYSEQLRKSLAKEIATGENSANYRASSPLGFEYASQVNSGNTSAASYSTWKGNQNNIHDALDHHVTNSRELVGMKRSSLEEMYDLAQKGQMQESDIDRISRLARSTINERDKTGVWDSTKETVINQLANLRTVQTQPKQPSIIMGTEGQFQEEMRQRHNNPPKPSGQNNNN